MKEEGGAKKHTVVHVGNHGHVPDVVLLVHNSPQHISGELHLAHSKRKGESMLNI